MQSIIRTNAKSIGIITSMLIKLYRYKKFYFHIFSLFFELNWRTNIKKKIISLGLGENSYNIIYMLKFQVIMTMSWLLFTLSSKLKNHMRKNVIKIIIGKFDSRSK